MSMPPGVPEDPHAPPTAPMYPVQPQYQPPQPPQPPQAPPAPPQYSAPQYSAPQYEPPTAPAAPQYPGGAPAYPPAPSGGYTTPPSAAPAYPGGMGTGDPLVLPPGSSFSAWFAKVQEVGKRSWKSALLITGLGVAVPYGIAGLVGGLGSWNAGLSFFAIGGFFTSLGTLFLGWFLAFLVGVAGCFVAAAGWAGGTWALVQEAGGQRPSIGAAFSYGFKRAMALFPWTVLAAVAFAILSRCLWLPGVYAAFAVAFFGFVSVFERGQNPIGRSINLTHNSATFGPTAGKIGIFLAVGSAYYGLINVIEGVLSLIANAATFGSFTYNLLSGFVELIGGLLMAPLFAVLLIGLLPTYLELRARQQPLSTPQLQQELG